MRYLEALLERYVDRVFYGGPDDCWAWLGQVNNWGYGVVTVGGVRVPVHRVFYEALTNQEIPSGLFIDHLCCNKLCLNPAHMEPVTNGENVRRAQKGIPARRPRPTHCKWGHLLPELGRKCRTCNRIRTAEYRARKADV